jgi:hypothetical protein
MCTDVDASNDLHSRAPERRRLKALLPWACVAGALCLPPFLARIAVTHTEPPHYFFTTAEAAATAGHRPFCTADMFTHTGMRWLRSHWVTSKCDRSDLILQHLWWIVLCYSIPCYGTQRRIFKVRTLLYTIAPLTSYYSHRWWRDEMIPIR